MSEHLMIDRDRCMGSGQCTFYAPQTFDLDDDSIAIVTDEHGDPQDEIAMAITVCPTRAIAWAERREDEK
ncbi:ferredoxin [Rathayibacter sp. VKM Ac-2835]|uniref:ferredoxin n=1 Tax=Rathayibacter sp. VKM Ac-2835 TaxID=2739043 RepID=UPI001567191C|nr:ferredoxin [Rathayibacter sp. VKM Ac-2835]NRG41046.1 ferredoxin [Rathayibacter sp. VKM Ac-2835]